MIIAAQIIFILSILGILFFIGRRIPDVLKFPRSSEKENSFQEEITGGISKHWKKVREKADSSEFLHDTIIPKTEKLLRRLKIIVLKFDNFLAKRADKLRARIRKRKRENME